jgi:hypothetical protein
MPIKHARVNPVVINVIELDANLVAANAPSKENLFNKNKYFDE